MVMNKLKNKKKAQKIRLIVQLFFLFLVIWISFNHFLVEKGKNPILIGSPSLHAVCPFGGVETAYTFFTSGGYVRKAHQSSFVLMWLVILLSLLLGAVFCGWVCPFGTIQEFFGKIGKKIFKSKYNTFIPKKLDKILRYFRYIVLAWTLYNTAIAGKLIFSDFDPYYALFNFWSSEVTITSLIILFFVIIGSLFIERPWCKYLCPYGAFLGLFNYIRIFKLKRNTNTCIDCKICDIKCPMNINISNKKIINDHQCISCLICTDEINCPKDNTLQFLIGDFKK